MGSTENCWRLCREVGEPTSALDSEGLIAVHMRRGALEEKRGDFAAAARHYGEAANQAERVDNKFAGMMAREKLASVEAKASQ